MALLEVNGLTTKVSGYTILDNLDFSVEANELRVLLGPNGAGKTTLIAMITGQFKPTSGKILFNGEDITGRSPDKIPFFNITETGQLELESTTTVWDGGPLRAGGALGTDPAPVTNTVPTGGQDPHGLVQATADARRQISEFLLPLGKLLDTCPPRKACRVDGYPY